MSKLAVLERFAAAIIIAYFAAGAFNEFDLERVDAMKPLPPGSPVIYHDVEFASAADAIMYKREAVRERWFPWAGCVGMPVCYLMLVGAAASYGGLFREIYDVTFTKAEARRRYLFGLFLGPLLLGVSVLAPFALIEADSLPTPRIATLLPISALCGCFAEKTWRLLGSVLGKLFDRFKE